MSHATDLHSQQTTRPRHKRVTHFTVVTRCRRGVFFGQARMDSMVRAVMWTFFRIYEILSASLSCLFSFASLFSKLDLLMKRKVTISYDPDADVLSWDVASRTPISHATEMGNFVVHFSKKNLPVLIEVLEASKIVKQSVRKIQYRTQAVTA